MAHYLNSHPSGVADVAFRVSDLNAFINRSDVTVLVPPQECFFTGGYLKWATIKGWDSLSHTLIEKTNFTSSYYLFCEPQLTTPINFFNPSSENNYSPLVGIDHLVLNVPRGDLEKAVNWYQNLFNFQVHQTFTIQTKYSGLFSKVLRSPDCKINFNINEPTSANSQIQEFLEANRGAGIQHIALQSTNLLQIIKHLRYLGVSFLSTPKTYYTQLKQQGRYGELASITEQEWEALETAQILVDWAKKSLNHYFYKFLLNPFLMNRLSFSSL